MVSYLAWHVVRGHAEQFVSKMLAAARGDGRASRVAAWASGRGGEAATGGRHYTGVSQVVGHVDYPPRGPRRIEAVERLTSVVGWPLLNPLIEFFQDAAKLVGSISSILPFR